MNNPLILAAMDFRRLRYTHAQFEDKQGVLYYDESWLNTISEQQRIDICNSAGESPGRECKMLWFIIQPSGVRIPPPKYDDTAESVFLSSKSPNAISFEGRVEVLVLPYRRVTGYVVVSMQIPPKDNPEVSLISQPVVQ